MQNGTDLYALDIGGAEFVKACGGNTHPGSVGLSTHDTKRERHVHHHGYLWTGPKERFDQEALRRPPHPEPPPAGSRPELIQRYREVAVEFPTSGLPPVETAYWLIKPRSLVRGTWREAKEATSWLSERLAEYAPRFASDEDREPTRLSRLVNAAAERLHFGTDVSYGFYLERPSYPSLAVVTCSPNRANAERLCPVAQPRQ